MTIYEELIERVHNGEPFSVDFEKKTLKIGKKKIIDNGEWDKSRKLIDFDGYVLKTIYELYHNYKYSLPSERSDSKRTKYFKTLPIEEIDDIDLISAERREIAQARLEGFILCTVLTGQFNWDGLYEKWFWQSETDPDLVILRSWII